MATVPVENRKSIPMHIAGRTIPPGEVRYFDESELPGYMRQPERVASDEVAPESGPDPLLAVLEDSVKDITAQLHTFSDDDLNRLDILEQAGENRKTLVSAIQNERLRRAEIMNDPDLTSVEKYARVHHVG
jgi:hypothetical protein